MTAVHDSSRTLNQAATLAEILGVAHETWINETEFFLAPATAPKASFWQRWTAVRYLADQFLAQYRRERLLLGELRPFLPPHVAEDLSREGEQIARLQGYLDQIGRRRGTARTVAVVARGLLEWLRCWCADIEAATWKIRRDVLPEEGKRLVAEIELYIQIHHDNRDC